MSAHYRQATRDYSKETVPETPSNTPSRTASRAPIGPWALAAAGVALAGVALAAAAEFSTVIKIRLNTVEVAHYTGMDRSSVALLVLAGLALVLIIGALRGARPAMAAIALAGLGILLVAVLIDVPHVHDKGVWPQNDVYEDAQATPGIGFYMETAAGVLLLLGGAAMLLLGARPERPAGRERSPVGTKDGPEVAAEEAAEPVVPAAAP